MRRTRTTVSAGPGRCAATARGLRRLAVLLPVLLVMGIGGAGLTQQALAAQVTVTIFGPQTAQVWLAQSYTANPSSGVCGSAATTWNWGDNSQQTQVSGTQTSHAFVTQGSFNVSVTYQDTCGNTGFGSLFVSTSGTGTGTGCTGFNQGVVVSVSPSPQSAPANSTITFTALASSQFGGGASVTYNWQFGDGQTNISSGVAGQPSTVTHLYSSPGTFTVSVNATISGISGCGSTTVSIGTGTGTGTGSINVAANGPYTGCVNQPVSFGGFAISNSGAQINSYSWSFGDNTTGVGRQVQHTYTSPGSFTVTLTAIDTNGQNGSATTSAQINAGCTGGGTGTVVGTGTATQSGVTANTGGPYSGGAGNPISFSATASTTNPGASIISYVWSFGDNTSATGQQATHTYSGNGTYTVALTVTDSTGAVVTATLPVTISGGNRTVQLVSGCNNVASTFPDNTPTGTIVAGVQPASALLSVWKLTDPLSVRYKGYFPGASQASDLPTVMRLDAIFICVSGPATYLEPSA
jgi:PKD repeat protein